MGWLQSIIEAIKQIFGFGEKIAENKSQKIPLQKEAIQERAETVTVKQDNKQHRLRQVIPKREIKAKVSVMNLKWVLQKKVVKTCYNLIESGEKITAIEKVSEGVRITTETNSILLPYKK